MDKLAGKALIAFLRIIVELDRNVDLQQYTSSSRLECRNTTFNLRMGFGLHAGWAIEGAVGSLQKVDATYLSPHVNMAARLETASRQYGVPLLVSQAFYELLSPFAQKKMRRLDVVTVKGSETPIEIYTYDTISKQSSTNASTPKDDDMMAPPMPSRRGSSKGIGTPTTFDSLPSLDESKETIGGSEKIIRKRSMSSKSLLPKRRNSLFNSSHDPDEVIDQDPDMINLRAHINDAFIEEFAKGVNKYITGDWPTAKGHFEKSNEIMIENALTYESSGDGPSQTLLKYMGSHEFKAPDNWQGFRPLTSK